MCDASPGSPVHIAITEGQGRSGMLHFEGWGEGGRDDDPVIELCRNRTLKFGNVGILKILIKPDFLVREEENDLLFK